ncbi:MAG: hypothetical protein Q9216_000612 [Gyalolechia sp. 2 TL-2023]
MPSSPRTPTRRRKSSNLGRSFSSPQSLQYSPAEKRSSRRFSNSSLSSPVSIKSASLHHDSLNFGSVNPLDRGPDDENGLGNLADELSEAWDHGSGHSPQFEHHALRNGDAGSNIGFDEHHEPPTFEIHHDTGIRIADMSYDGGKDNLSLSPPKQSAQARSRRKPSNIPNHDGSDYGDDPDLDVVEGISASLEYHLATIDSLARRGFASCGSEADDVVTRLTESLRDLGSQAVVETGATRLVTAHTAVSSNLTHQIRLVQTLSHHFVSPFSIPPTADEVETLLPLLASTIELLPPPDPRVISLLHSLRSSAADLTAMLSALADSLHMLRQTTSLASRRLKVAKDTVDDFRRESQMRDEGIRWVEQGNWDIRLSSRECGTICGDVVDGFKDACETWGEMLRKSTMGSHALEPIQRRPSSNQGSTRQLRTSWAFASALFGTKPLGIKTWSTWQAEAMFSTHVDEQVTLTKEQQL